MEVLTYFAPWLVVPCILQTAALWLTRDRFRLLRFLLPAAAGWKLLQAALVWGQGGLFIGLSQLAALVCLIQAGMILAGWGLGWLAGWRLCRRKEGT